MIVNREYMRKFVDYDWPIRNEIIDMVSTQCVHNIFSSN